MNENNPQTVDKNFILVSHKNSEHASEYSNQTDPGAEQPINGQKHRLRLSNRSRSPNPSRTPQFDY